MATVITDSKNYSDIAAAIRAKTESSGTYKPSEMAAAVAKIRKNGGDFKVIYGVEGYFVNNVDDRVVVHGKQDCSIDDEFVCFDIETTGLNRKNEVIIEIGAVILKNGQEIDRFQTFVDPERTLDRKIVDLTGITDEMLVGAPKIEEVLPKFLDFVGGRVLVAHNSDFDTGFIRAECQRQGIPYHFTAVDTLILSQNLLQQRNMFKLDIVANALSLPEFTHHRAADDAVTCGMIMARLMKKMEEEQAKLAGIRGEVKDIAWGSQIRSYVFMPYTLVKDHRTSFETGNINAVMDGDIDGFINAYLKMQSQKNLENN